MNARQEILPAETLIPSCRGAEELADQIGVLVSKAVGTHVTINAMSLGMANPEGENVTIKWKRGKKHGT